MSGKKLMRGILIFLGSLSITQCVEPYAPPEIKEKVDLLVVDGFMNSTDSSVEVRLSKAVALSETGRPPVENNAAVRVEDEAGNIYPVFEVQSGIYRAEKIKFNPALKYRLAITTSQQQEYISDYIELQVTPPIDSITWGKSLKENGLSIYANTHDPSGEAQYYQWTFSETWEYSSGHYSQYKIQNGEVVPQDVPMHQCWITKPSTEILIASTTHLSQNSVRNFELTFIPLASQKLERTYSIEVEQRALSKEAYDFWVQLKKTTETLGSLFDPLPSQVTGNIKDKNDASQPVLGYFTGGSVAKKRIFISFSQLPRELQEIMRRSCPLDFLPVDLIPSYPDMNLVSAEGYPVILGYLYSAYSGCMDCRDGGGDIVRPTYWQ
jgi:hypothetical protein